MRPLALAALLVPALLGGCETDTYCPAPDSCHASGTRNSAGQCVTPALPEGTHCDDHDACTDGDKCQSGSCSGTAVVCEVTACQVATACDHTRGCGTPTDLPEGSACDDKSACTANDHCASGACAGELVVHCTGPALDACHLPEACDPKSGACVSEALTGPCVPNLMPSPTMGCTYNVYGALVNMGNSNQTLLLDSGSTTLATASGNCNNCIGITPRYAPSSDAVDQSRDVSSSYLDGTSWSGRTYLDRVKPLGTQNTAHLRLAAINRQNGFFRDYGCILGRKTPNFYQGIIGLAGANFAVPGTDSYMDKVQSALPFNAFTNLMCNPNGLIWWGGYDPAVVASAPHYTPMSTSAGFYSVSISDISVGTQSIARSADATSGLTNVVVDTGTSLTLLSKAAVTGLANQLATNATFVKNFGDPNNAASSAQRFFLIVDCQAPAYDVTIEELDAALPRLTLTFPSAQGDFAVSLKATESYLQPMPIDAGHGGGTGFCPGVTISPNSANGTATSITLLGASGMIGNLFIFDRAGGKLGIAPTHACAEM